MITPRDEVESLNVTHNTHPSPEPARRASKTRSNPDFHICRMVRVRRDIVTFPLTGTRAGAMLEMSSS